MSGATFEELFKGKQNKVANKLHAGGDLLGRLEAVELITHDDRLDIEV